MPAVPVGTPACLAASKDPNTLLANSHLLAQTSHKVTETIPVTIRFGIKGILTSPPRLTLGPARRRSHGTEGMLIGLRKDTATLKTERSQSCF